MRTAVTRILYLSCRGEPAEGSGRVYEGEFRVRLPSAGYAEETRQ